MSILLENPSISTLAILVSFDTDQNLSGGAILLNHYKKILLFLSLNYYKKILLILALTSRYNPHIALMTSVGDFSGLLLTQIFLIVSFLLSIDL